MKVKVTILVLFAFVISANFLYAREASNPRAKQDSQRFSVKDYSQDSRVNQTKDRPHWTKRQLIHAAINRERSRNSLEPLLKSEFDEQYPGIDQVPGGGDIFDAWHVTFDTEADFNSFNLFDLSGDGNDWFWNEVGTADPANAAVAPQPPVGETREEGIRVKFGVPKKSTAGDSYRVAQLQTDVLVNEGDPDDFLDVGVLQGPKWHRDDFGSHTAGDSVWWVGDKMWDTWGYGNMWLEYLDTNPIDLTGTTAPTLSINTTWLMEAPSATYGWDAATVFALSSADADYDTWTEIAPASGYTLDNMFAWNIHWANREDVVDDTDPGDYTAGNHSGWGGGEDLHPGEGWHIETFDLTAFIGETIIIRFALAGDECYSPAQASCEGGLEGDGGTFDGGWWLDDITVNDGGGANLVTDLTPDHDGIGFEPEPWVSLGTLNADAPGTGAWQAAYGVTRAIIGSFDDSLTIGFYAEFDADNTAAPDGGFEVSDALFQVFTRLLEDAGATFVGLVDAAGDSVLQDYGYAFVGATYDPVTTIENFSLSDIPIWSAYLEIENSFGDLVYEEFSYQYNDTLEIDESRDFTFPAWTPAYEGDYTVRAYFDLFGGDDEPLNDAIEASFHAFNTIPDYVFEEDFNAPTTDSSLFANGWMYESESAEGDTSLLIADYFGEGDTEIWWYTAVASADSMNETVITPPVDLTGTTDNAMYFYQYLNNTASFGPEGAWTLEILGRPDASTAWTVLNSVNGATAYALRYAPYRLDISAFDGEATFQAGFRFRMSVPDLMANTPLGYATIDDIMIYAGADVDGPAAGPANVLAVSGDMEATVSWDPVAALDVMNYSVYGAYDYVVPGCELAYVEVIIVPDDYPEETSWDITDAADVVVAEGDADGGTACLALGDYTFTIYDAYGDGMDGSYAVIAGDDDFVDAPTGFSGTSSAHAFSIIGTSPGPDMIATSNFVLLSEVSDLTWTHEGLDNGTTYYYYVIATDHNGNESTESETVSVVPADVTPPTDVTDLRVVNLSPTSSRLEWTAPEETVPGEGSVYEIRWANAPITDTEPSGEGLVNWHDATLFVVGPVADEGTPELFQIEHLTPGIDDYFALKTVDEVGNTSEMSNVVNNDHVPPAIIGDLEVVEFDETSITFGWTAPGDDGNNGVAVAYDLRVAYGSDMDWETATPLAIDLIPGVAGSKQVFTVSENIFLSYALAFAIVALDNNGNASEISNVLIWRPNGIVPSSITEIVDIPEDQGYQVRVSWTASDNEGDPGSLGVTFYGLWRLIEMPADAVANIVTNYIDLFNAAPTATVGDKFRVVNGTDVISEWDFIANVPAHADELYNFVAPTLVNEANSTFMVSAHSVEGFIANSAPVAGISVDNLAPSQVTGLMATITESETVLLSWEENDDAYLDRDLAHYAIYRSEGAEFTLLATAEAIEFIDETVTSGATYDYYLTAVDFSDNESEASAIVTSGVVAIDLTAGLPESFKLSQNYPNPFNPETAIEFALPEDAFVKLTIFNILGQEVRSLTSSQMAAGVYRVVWNGRDNNGRELTSGTYIYRIQAGNYSKTMKMAYIK